MVTHIIYFIKVFILSPLALFVIALTGLALWKRSQKLGYYLVVAGIGLLFTLCLPITSGILMGLVEKYPPLNTEQIKSNDVSAIVVLGGGREYRSPEFDFTDRVSHATLIRLRYGVYIHRLTKLPILVTGGIALKGDITEAELMANSLRETFNVEPEWQESRSSNTAENAKYTAEILQQNDIDSIFLVSHAWHLRRAVEIYQQYGLKVVPAPTAFASRQSPELSFYDFVPTGNALHHSFYALHELIGYIWYKIRY